MSASTVSLDLTDIPSICREYHVRTLDLFGSAATGKFDPDQSDVDMVVAFEDMDAGFYADAYFGLHAALEAKFDRRVDLLTERSIENPFLRQSIEATRRRVYASP